MSCRKKEGGPESLIISEDEEEEEDGVVFFAIVGVLFRRVKMKKKDIYSSRVVFGVDVMVFIEPLGNCYLGVRDSMSRKKWVGR